MRPNAASRTGRKPPFGRMARIVALAGFVAVIVGPALAQQAAPATAPVKNTAPAMAPVQATAPVAKTVAPAPVAKAIFH